MKQEHFTGLRRHLGKLDEMDARAKARDAKIRDAAYARQKVVQQQIDNGTIFDERYPLWVKERAALARVLR